MSSRYLVSRVRFIAAAPDRIFEILATPAMHSEIDGSGTVRGARPKGPGRLGPGAKFGMEMNIRVNYRILNRDARHIRGKFLLRVAGYLRRHPENIDRTLARVEKYVTGAEATH